MKSMLQQIYRDVSEGKLLPEDALTRITTLKLHGSPEFADTLLATAGWEASAPAAASAGSRPEYVQRHIVLCELPQVDVEALQTLAPGGRCRQLQAGRAANVAERYNACALACFESLQAIVKSKPHGPVLFQLAVANVREEVVLAGLSGLLKTAMLECPQLVCQLIMTEAHTTAVLAEQLQSERAGPLDTLVKYEGGVRSVLRWQALPAQWPETPAQPAAGLKERGVYLITGGLGRLGLLFAKEILERSPRARIILTGRSAPTDATRAVLDGLPLQAGHIEYRQLDILQPDRVRDLIVAIESEHKQLNGIIHSAGMIADNFILRKTPAEFTRVLAPKVVGTYCLDEASRDVDLDFLVLFSSVAGALGNLGQADYAAANGFMDRFAAYRNQLVARQERRGRTLSINWTLWREGGMGLDLQGPALQTGLQPLETSAGMQAFQRILELPCDQVLVMQGELPRLHRVLATQTMQPEFPPARALAEQPVAQTTRAALPDTRGLAQQTEDYLCEQFATVLKVPPHRIDAQAALEKYGIDSILAVSLINQLEKTFGPLRKTLLFEYQTIRALSEYLLESHAAQLRTLLVPSDNQQTTPATHPQSLLPPTRRLRAATERRAREPPAGASRRLAHGSTGLGHRGAAGTPATNREPIAIVGLSGRYPEAPDVEAYWENLRQGKDCIIEVPRERWDWRDYFTEDRTRSGHHYSKWGGFITGVDEFDPLFFNISPKDAKYMDPQERLFLQHAWMAIEDSGHTRASLQVPDASDLPGQVGVYVGAMYSEYQLFGAEASLRGNRVGVSGSFGSIANRVSYVLNLHGPSMTLDTMCSSSLTAIHLACQDLTQGRTSLAIAGGVNVTIHPNKYLLLSGGQFISSDGRCQSFGEGSDGYIPGEGVGVVILKRLSDAERDGNHIYGLIRGTSLNHGGKTNGYTVPNPQAQADVIRRALAEAGVSPRHVSYIEAHGTGTKLGDPIEITALSRAFHDGARMPADEVGFCQIGSAKSNIGHCESAAGIAGLTKVLLQMKHRLIVPSLHSNKLNPHIDFDDTPFVVNQSLREWQPLVDGSHIARIAGISSFGAGGSNAHIIVEESPKPLTAAASTRIAGPQLIVPLSARTEQQLEQKARDLLVFITRTSRAIDLESMAYSLQVGREAMDHRLAFLVSSVEELTHRLQAFLSAAAGSDGLYRDQVAIHRDVVASYNRSTEFQRTLESSLAGKNLARLAAAWVKGVDFDWHRLSEDGGRPRLMSLPVYPFAKERYWLEPSASAAPAAAGAIAVLHPLVHRNTADLQQQSYVSTFAGNEFFLRNDALTGQKVVSELLGLEMMRVALELASPQRPESGYWELRNVAWDQPMIVSGGPVSVQLWARADNTIDVQIHSKSEVDDVVHCQSHAVFTEQTAPARLDLAQLRAAMRAQPGPLQPGVVQCWRGEGQLLAVLAGPDRPEELAANYGLRPAVIDIVSGLLSGFIGQSLSPSSLDCLRVVCACSQGPVLWLRYASSGGINIDICSERGDVCVQMLGLQARSETSETSETVPTAVEHTEPGSEAGEAHPGVASKPTVTLAGTDELQAPAPAREATAILLDPLPDASQAAPAATLSVGLSDLGDGVWSVETDTIDSLCQALYRAGQEPSLKTLLIASQEHGFWQGGREACNEAIKSRLLSAVASFPAPVIAVVRANALGVGLLLSLVCDVMVCSEDGRHGYTDPQLGLFPSESEEQFFRARLGAPIADDLLYRSAPLTGQELRQKGWGCWIVPTDRVHAKARELAADFAQKSSVALRLLKAHLGRRLIPLIHALTVDAPLEQEAQIRCDDTGGTERITLSSTQCVALEEQGSVLVVKVIAAVHLPGLEGTLADLREIFGRISDSRVYKAVVLSGDYGGFLPGSVAAGDLGAVTELRQLVQDCKLPVISALPSGAEGLGWLLGLWSDFCVYQAQGGYCAGGNSNTPALATEAATLLMHRLGSAFGAEVGLTESSYSGLQLQARVGALQVVDSADVIPHALRLAAFWCQWPLDTVTGWKSARRNHSRNTAETQPTWSGGETEEAPISAAATPAGIPLDSNTVAVTAHPDGVVVISMQDREAKNLFSEALSRGLKEAFAHIEQTPAYKVVVLTGYDSYFAAGGTRETLLAIQEGRARFTDERVFQLPMDCSLPVIAAMQGHAIGGGWSFGMFADLILLSAESHYSSPYMGYGFTPGAGSTLVFPEKIGHDLARETLLTAREMSGRELQERGLPLTVLPRRDVVPAAIDLARRMARNPREWLKSLKQQWTHALRQSREEVYQCELAMHEQTFVGNSLALERIQAGFPGHTPAGPGVLKAPAQIHASTSNEIGRGSTELAAVLDKIRELLAQELHMRSADIDERAQFVDLGLDSVTGVTWMRRINEHFGTNIEATKVYNHPTLAELAHYVKVEAEQRAIPSSEPAPVALQARVAPVRARRKLSSWRSREQARLRAVTDAPEVPPFEPVAVIGMAGQFPKASDLEEFWTNIATGSNCIEEISRERWSLAEHYQEGSPVPGKTYSKWLGAIPAYDLFDPLFFNISPTEAKCMDPQQRVFLQACWHAIESAGYSAQSLSGSRCGIFAGCAAGDYHQLSPQQQLSAQGFTGSATSILAGRVGYFLNLRGPCVSIDTACSSSLVAIANACDSLNSGTSDLALAGGVYVMAGPAMHIMTSQAGMLSTEGRCFSFDQRANGFVVGEGVGVVVLKRLADALRDHDRIDGVIQGWGVNQDGRTNGITAPNQDSQTRLLQSVYERFRIDPVTIGLIEAHGTGTRLGDPIEVAGLQAAFKAFTAREDYCALGSVKSNIGHCLTASGVAGLIKVVLALKHRQLPPTINFAQLNEHIQLARSPFYVNDRLRDWHVAGDEIRRAAVSSFGFSGTNAHLVIGEGQARQTAKPAVVAITQDSKIPVLLSARTAQQLTQRCVDLLDFLRKDGRRANLLELAYTLQVGREAMEERAAFLVKSSEDLSGKLAAFIEGRRDIADVYQGQKKLNREAVGLLSRDEELKEIIIERSLAQAKLARLADLWVKGLDVNWNRLYGETKPQRMELPGYPFAKERYWIDREDINTVNGVNSWLAAGPRPAILHPLLQANTSDLSQCRYSSTFTGREPFFKDHWIKGKRALPALGSVEMAMQAVGRAAGRVLLDESHTAHSVMQLRDVHWRRPIVVEHTPVEVEIELFAQADGEIAYEIHSRPSDAGAELLLHGAGSVSLTSAQECRVDLADLRRKLQEMHLDGTAAETLEAAGYGHAFQAIEKVFASQSEMLVQLSEPDATTQLVLADAGIQIGLGTLLGLNPESLLRYSSVAAASIEIRSADTKVTWAWVRRAAGSEEAGRIDIDLCDAKGRVLTKIRGLSFAGRQGDLAYLLREADRDWLWLTESWAPTALGTTKHRWLDRIRAHSNHSILVISSDLSDYSAVQRLCSEVAQTIGTASALWNVEHAPVELDAQGRLTQLDLQSCLSHANGVRTIFLFLPSGSAAGAPWRELEIPFTCVHALLKSAAEQSVELYCCYRDTGSQRSIYRESLGGLFRSAMLECANHRYRSLAFAGGASSPAALALLAVQEWLCDSTVGMNAVAVPMVRYSHGERHELQISQIRNPALLSETNAFRDDATYLIIDAGDNTGAMIGEELARRYNARFIILEKNHAEEPKSAVGQIEASRGSLLYRSVDILDLEALQHEMQALRLQGVQIHGVVNVEHHTSHASIARASVQELCETVAAGAAGVLNIDVVTAGEPLEFFLMLTSGSMSGSRESPGFACSTAFQNALARYRNELVKQRARSGRTLAIRWQRQEEEIDAAAQSALFVDALSAINIMDMGLQSEPEATTFVATSEPHETPEVSPAPQALAANGGQAYDRIRAFEKGEISRDAFVDYLSTLQVDALAQTVQQRIVQAIERFERGSGARPRGAVPGPAQHSASPGTLNCATAKPAASPSALERILANIEKVLGLKAHAIDCDKPFQDYGLDSILAVKLTSALEKEFSCPVTPAWLVEHATVNALTDRLNRDLAEH